MLVALDTECTLNEVSHKKRFKSSPHSKDNYIVYLGLLSGNEKDVKVYKKEDVSKAIINLIDSAERNEPLIIAGHNIKYDLLYLYKDKALRHKILEAINKDKLAIWDTQIVEYLLTGQEVKFASLDTLSIHYGLGIVKDSRMKEFWDKGISTELIPENIIIPYLKSDVEMTYKIAQKQMALAERKKMLPLILTQMEAALAIIDCEYNGIRYDVTQALNLEEKLNKELEVLDKEMLSTLKKVLIEDYKIDEEQVSKYLENNRKFNLHSNSQTQAIVYGGKLPLEHEIPTGILYKSGKRKGQEKTRIERDCIFIPVNDTVRNIVKNTLSLSTNESCLSKIVEELPKALVKYPNLVMFIEYELAYRAKRKLLSTYIAPVLEHMIWDDGRIHHTLHQCQTVTGRLSSSNPNLQNIPKKSKGQVKNLFIPEEGYALIEIDYSQLEVVCAAYITQDSRLISDIIHGVDMHKENASVIFNVPKEKVTSEQRTAAKVATFQLQYGAGVNTIADAAFSGNISIAKEFVKAYTDRYPKLNSYFKSLYEQLSSKVRPSPSGELTPKGNIVKVVEHTTATSRILKFKTYDSPPWCKDELTTLSTTEVKNYPVQSLATGDIVPMMMGKVFKNVVVPRNIQQPGSIRIVNTVHDSLLFEIKNKPNILPDVIQEIKDELEKVYDYLQEYYNITFNVPLNFDIQLSIKSWGDMEPLK